MLELENKLYIFEAPSFVRVGTTQIKEINGQKLFIANISLSWACTNTVNAQIAIWQNVFALCLYDSLYDKKSKKPCLIHIEGLNFFTISSTMKQVAPIIKELRKKGFRCFRRKKYGESGRKRITRKYFDNLPLKPELVPKPLWRKSLYRALGRDRRWRRIRKEVLNNAGGACEICGARYEKGMICHEDWDYDEDLGIATITGFELVCSDCNNVLHYGRSSIFINDTALKDSMKSMELYIRRETHMEIVNGISEEEKKEIFNYADRLHQRRSGMRWKVRISKDVRNSYPILKGVRIR